MLLKAAILHRGGKIRKPKSRETIGFDACVRAGLSDGNIQFLSEEQALTLQALNGLRDAAQHFILEISEGQLYMQAQAAVTLFRDLMQDALECDLLLELPKRVLPLATSVPTDLETLFSTEVSEIRKLLQPGRRRKTEAMARLRPLAILDSALRGEKGVPANAEMSALESKVAAGRSWDDIFEGVASVQIQTHGSGSVIELRLEKKSGIPVHLVPDGTLGASTVAVKRVNELSFYSLGLKQVAEKVSLTPPKALAVIRKLGLQRDSEYFKEIKVGRQAHKRYSQKAVQTIKEGLPSLDIDEIWKEFGPTRRAQR